MMQCLWVYIDVENVMNKVLGEADPTVDKSFKVGWDLGFHRKAVNLKAGLWEGKFWTKLICR